MLRSSTSNLQGFTEQSLPPADTGPGVPGKDRPARLLFITTGILGFTTLAKQIDHYAARRDDVDVTHIVLRGELWVKVLAKHVPISRAGWDLHSWRYLHLIALQLRRWFRGPVPLGRFDALHIATQGNALMPLADPGWTIPYAVHTDATATQECREFRKSLTAWGPFIRAEKKIFGRAAFITGMINWTCESLVSDYNIPRERVGLVRSSLKLPKPAPDPHTHAADRPRRIVFVGNNWTRKGGGRLVKWHQERWKDRVELHIFSSDAPKGLGGTNIFRHGRVPWEKLLSEILPTMDLFVLPTGEDVVPWAVLEAAGMGLPVVASRLAGLPELVLDRKTGFLVPWNDDDAFIAAVERLLDDDNLRSTMSDAARAHIQSEFNPDVWYNSLFDRMVKLAAEDDPRRPGAPTRD